MRRRAPPTRSPAAARQLPSAAAPPRRYLVTKTKWTWRAETIIGLWTVVLGRLAARAYRRDTQRQM